MSLIKAKTELAAARAGITEIFSSVQGEGLFIGKNQIFVRFAGCNTHCAYCDEKAKELRGGHRHFSPAALMSRIEDLEAAEGPHHSVSLTGGEPLLAETRFLEELLKALKKAGFKVYLESNGTLPEALRPVLRYIDIIAMDFKLPSVTGGRAYWREHAEFLSLARAKDVFVKMVVGRTTLPGDVSMAVETVRRMDARIPLVFQPVSAAGTGRAETLKFIRKKLMRSAAHTLEDVRMIPQIHKILGVK